MLALAALLLVTRLAMPADAVPPVRQDGATIEDIIAGYRQNYYAFRTLHVTGRRVVVPAPSVEAAMRLAGTATEEVIQLNLRSRAFLFDAWTDRVGYQIRFPDTQQDGLPPDEVFVFPDAPLTAASLPVEFKSILVFSSTGNPQDGIRIWGGVSGKKRVGAIRSEPPPGHAETYLPPFGMQQAIDGWTLNPIDEFFLTHTEALRLIGQEQFRGKSTYVVEKRFPDAKLTSDWKKGSEEFTVYWKHRAWVDPGAGFIPRRIEKSCYFVANGVEFDNPWGLDPTQTVDVSQIEKIDGGGYFPKESVGSEFGLNPADSRPFQLPAEIIQAGKGTGVGRSLWREVRWEVSRVVAGVDMTGLFDFQFPEGTTFYDYRESSAKYVGQDGVDQFLGGRALPKPPAGVGGGQAQWFPWVLAAINCAAIAAVVFFLWRRSRR